MKKRFKNRKQFQEMAQELGFFNKTELVVFEDEINKKQRMLLANNHKRYVRGMLSLSPAEQANKIKVYKELKVQMLRDALSGTLEETMAQSLAALEPVPESLETSVDRSLETSSHSPTDPTSQG